MTIVQEPASLADLHSVPTSVVRRRRAVAILTALVAASAVAVIGTRSAWSWGALAAAAAAAGAYAVAWRRAQHREMDREFAALLGGGEGSLDGMSDLSIPDYDTLPRRDPPRVPAPGSLQVLGVVRFAVCYAAGWALAPVVFALTVAVGRTPRDTTGQRWLAILRATQARLRDQSMRTLAVTATATASVTAVGGVALLSGGGIAVAAPAPSASVSVGAPAAAGIGGQSAAGGSYTVVEGDTLSSIAARFGTTWEALAAANGIGDPNLIYPGQLLVISGGNGASTPDPAPAAGSSGASTYTVATGDTLSSIAARFGTTWEALAEINGLANPNFITVGEVLDLTGQGGGSAVAPAALTAATPTADSSPDPSPAPTPSAPASAAAIAVQTALAQVGKPYEWGGAGPDAFDCSGLVMYAWDAAGVQLAHYTVSQYQETTRISQSELQPGDLVFYDTGDGAQPGHVTMYIGNGQIVTADEPGTVIRVENLDWDGIPMGFGQVNG